MQINFTENEKDFFCRLFQELIRPGLPREIRRPLTRLGLKFTSNANTTFLKPEDRHRLLNILFRFQEVLFKSNDKEKYQDTMAAIFKKLKTDT